MFQEEAVKHWATSCNISADAVDKLFEDGFTSTNAIKLIDTKDFAKSKILRGQKKLISKCVKMLKGERGGDTYEPDDASSDPQVPLQTSRAPQTSATVGMRAIIQLTNQHLRRSKMAAPREVVIKTTTCTPKDC